MEPIGGQGRLAAPNGGEEQQKEVEGARLEHRQSGEIGSGSHCTQSGEQRRGVAGPTLWRPLKDVIDRNPTLLRLEASATGHLHISMNLSRGVAFGKLIFTSPLVSDVGTKALCAPKGFHTPWVRREWYLEVRGVGGQWSDEPMGGLGQRAEMVHLGWGTFRAADTGHLGAQPGRSLGWSRVGSCPEELRCFTRCSCVCLLIGLCLTSITTQCCHEMP